MHEGSDAGSWFEEALAEPDPAAALRLVGSVDRIRESATDPDAAVAVLRAVAALAWRTDEVAALAERIPRWPQVPAVVRARERVQLDLAAGREFRRAYTPVLPPYLHELLAVAPFVDGPRRADLATALRAELMNETATYLELLETLHLRCHELATALTMRLLDDVAWARRELPAMLPEHRAQLDRALDGVGGGFLATMVTTGAIGAGMLGFGAGIIFDPAMAVAGGGGAALLMTSMRGQVYRRFVRVPLAGVLARCGVTRACARERMMQRGGMLRRFAGVAGGDNAMRLFGMIAAAAMTMEEQGGPTWKPAW